MDFIICDCSLEFIFSRTYLCILRQIPVFLRQFIRGPFLMVHFCYPFLSNYFQFLSNPLLFYWVDLHACESSYPSIVGGVTKLEMWMDSNG